MLALAAAKQSFARADEYSDPGAAFVRIRRASDSEEALAQASGCERSRPRLRPGPIAAEPWLRTRRSGVLAGIVAAGDAVDALAVCLLGRELEAQLLAHHRGEKPTHRMRLPPGRAHDPGDGGAIGPAQQRKHARLFRMRPPLVRNLAACLRPDLR